MSETHPNEMRSEARLGDVIDDYCIKCRRLTNHSIVSIVDDKAAKVRCRTCYNDHDYRFEQAPPTKKDIKKAELFRDVLSTLNGGQPAPPPEPKQRGRAKRIPPAAAEATSPE